MKPPTFAPFFACLYPGLCEVARKKGYALTIHGTVTADLDLVAIPWVESAVSAIELKDALMKHIGACGYADLLRRNGVKEAHVRQIMTQPDSKEASGITVKPHGRLSWNLYLDAGAKIDLSVMPKYGTVSRESVIAVIDAEEELEGEMPDELYITLTSGKHLAAEVMRKVVRTAKRNIKRRFEHEMEHEDSGTD